VLKELVKEQLKGKGKLKHRAVCSGLEKLEVDLRRVEASNRVTYQKVLLGAVKARRHKNVGCLWEWDGKWEDLYMN